MENNATTNDRLCATVFTGTLSFSVPGLSLETLQQRNSFSVGIPVALKFSSAIRGWEREK